MLEQREHLVIAEFNMAATLEELRKIIVGLGGKIVDEKGHEKRHHAYLISNRRLDKLKEQLISFANNCKKCGVYNKEKNRFDYEKVDETYDRKMSKLEELKQYDLGIVRVHQLLSMSFILNNVYYSISLNDNPNYDFYYDVFKTNGKNCINFKNYSSGHLSKSLFDYFYGYDYDHKKVANNIFDFLTNENPRGFNPYDKVVQYVECIYE